MKFFILYVHHIVIPHSFVVLDFGLRFIKEPESIELYILIITNSRPGPAPLLLLKYETWKLLFNSRFILHYSSDISVGESILSMPVPPPPLQTAPYQPLSSPQNRTLKTWEMELLSFSTTAKSIDFFLWRKSCIILLLRALVWNLN